MILGHETQINLFKNAFLDNACHHAWLLKGQKGIGKYKCALEFAKYILNCEFDLQTHSHPDLKIVSKKDDKSINVEDVRSALDFLNKTTVDGGWKVFLIDSMGDLNIHSQNSLLKILEEPRPKTIFFIIVHDGEQMLSTIKSRAIPLVFAPLSNQILERYMMQNHPGVAQEYIHLGCGSIGRLEEMIAKDGISIYQFMIECILSGKQFSFSHLALKHTPLFLAQMMAIFYHRFILMKTGQMGGLIYKNEQKDLEGVSKHIDWQKIGSLFKNLRSAQNLHLESSSIFLDQFGS